MSGWCLRFVAPALRTPGTAFTRRAARILRRGRGEAGDAAAHLGLAHARRLRQRVCVTTAEDAGQPAGFACPAALLGETPDSVSSPAGATNTHRSIGNAHDRRVDGVPLAGFPWSPGGSRTVTARLIRRPTDTGTSSADSRRISCRTRRGTLRLPPRAVPASGGTWSPVEPSMPTAHESLGPSRRAHPRRRG